MSATKSLKEQAHKTKSCQSCGTKAPGYSIIVDPPAVGEVKKVKAREGKSYWCSDCASKKVKVYEANVERKRKERGLTKAQALKGEKGSPGSATAAPKKAPKKPARKMAAKVKPASAPAT